MPFRSLALLPTLIVLAACAHHRVDPLRGQERAAFLWCDATANLDRIHTVEGLTEVLDWCAEVGLDAVVIDVRPISGHVLYPSALAPRLERWPLRSDPGTMWTFDPDFDLLAEACRLGHQRGLDVYASMNVFSGGHKFIAQEHPDLAGPVFNEKPEWAAVDYIQLADEEEPRLRPTHEHAQSYTAFLSPHHPEVRAFLLALIQEVVTEYPIDGIVLDRVRYDNYYGDFSEWGRIAFEEHLGRRVENWPEDVYVRTGNASDALEPGPLWDEWRLFRAQTIHDFFVEARQHVKAADPDCVFADYVGAWYPIYDEVGVNWASPRNTAHLERFPPGWQRAGYADELDLLFTGNYFYAVTPDEIPPHPRGFEGDWLSVVGSAQIAEEVVRGDCPVVGSLYVEQYISGPDQEFNAEQWTRAMEGAYLHSDGLMIFDLVHIANFDAWDTVADFLAEHHTPSPAAAAPSN